MSRDAQVHVCESSVIIEMGDMSIMFSAPTELGTGKVDVLLLGNGQPIHATVDSKTIMGALKALDVGHVKRKLHKEAELRWKISI